jgi:hypothetical protein
MILQVFLSRRVLPRIRGPFLRTGSRRDKYARSLDARGDENLSAGISWFSFLLQSPRFA